MTNHSSVQGGREAPASEGVPSDGLTVREFCAGRGVLLTIDASSSANALTAQMVFAIRAVLDDAARRGVHVVAFAGRGRTFCGGFDLASLENATDAELTGRFLDIQRMLDSLRAAPFVTVALVDGSAVGAGADLVLACDHRLGTGNSRFRFPGIRFGLLLGTIRLVKVIGRERALDVLLRQQVIPAAEAVDLGLLTARCSSSDFEPFLSDLCEATSQLDDSTLRMLLQITRGLQTDPTASLVGSFGTHGLADRMRSYVRDGVREARADSFSGVLLRAPSVEVRPA